MSPSKTEQRIADILTAAKQTLDIAQGPLTLAPIPGLSSAASALSGLIGIILVAEGNKGLREDIAKHIQELTSIIERTRKMAESVMGTDDENLTKTRLVNSPELSERVATLEKDLKDLTDETKRLEIGFLGFLLSKKNGDILLRIRTGIDDAARKFYIQGGMTVEMLINGVVTDIQQMKRMQQEDRLDRERAERERAEWERSERERKLNEKALKDLPHVNAGYSSASNPTKSGTLEGTRTALLQEITDWSLRPRTSANDSFIYVLSGGAGTGKSTIAFEIARRLEDAGALGASFFFVRDASSFNTTTYVLATIAYQLAHNHPSLYPHIVKAARQYSRRGKQREKLEMDLDSLFIKPLKDVEASHRPIILVFDALDECTKAAQEEVIRLLFLFMERLPEIPFPVRIIVTTRPEMKIEAAFNTEKLRKVSKPFKLHEILREIVDGDIRLFLETKLKDLSCWETVFSNIPSVVDGLTNLAAGLFIYADTIVKFLDNNPYHAVDVLEAILSDNPSEAAFTLKNLDRLYIAVLQNALNDDNLDIPDMKKYIQIVLGSLALLQDQVSTSGLNDLIGVPMRFIRDILVRLGSVILKPELDDVNIRMLHASFPQFLVDIQRCTNSKFYIDPSVHHRRLALTCLDVMNTRYPPKRNICKLDDPTIMKSDILGLHDSVKEYIRPSLQYSCVHWATHLSQCNDPGQDILDAVMEFARTKLLVWVEVLSYMNRLEAAVPALLAALSWCETHMEDEDRNEIVQLIDDTHRLVLQCYTPINGCPEHLYISAFPFTASCVLTTRYDNFGKIPTCGHPIIQSMMPRDSAWGPCLHTIPIYAVNCRAMLSPDGKLIASGLDNGDVCIWDASIGFLKRTFDEHIQRVQCVAWSPDGESLASGSVDGIFRVWNATSGAQVHVQRVQSGKCEVYAISWSLDGTQLVTCADPGGVHVWDIVVGKELKERRAIPAMQTVLAISKALDRAVDWVTGAKLRLWDIGCENGKILKELPVRFTLYAAVFLHSDTQVAFSGLDDAIHLWDFESGEYTSKVRLESKVAYNGRTYISGIAVSQDGKTLASSTVDKIHFFDTKSWDSLGSIRGFFRYSASFSPDGRRLLTSYNTIDMLDSSSVLAPKPRITSSIPSLSSSPIAKHDSYITFVAISLDGSRVAAKSGEAVSIWSLKSASLICFIWGYFFGNVAFSPDAQKIAVIEFRKTCIWDITTAEPTLVQTISTATGADDRIAWSSDGLWIASSASDPNTDTTKGFGVFDALTGELVKYLARSSDERLFDVEFSHDNSLLYFQCGEDHTIFRWKEGEEVDHVQHKWKTERQQRMNFHKDAWIIRERDGKRLCWVQQRYPELIARWGNRYAVAKDSGRLDILHIEDSSVDTTKDS